MMLHVAIICIVMASCHSHAFSLSLSVVCEFSFVGGGAFFWFEPFPDLSTYACQIWSRSDSRVRKSGDRQTHTHTHTHTTGHCSFIRLISKAMMLYTTYWLWTNTSKETNRDWNDSRYVTQNNVVYQLNQTYQQCWFIIRAGICVIERQRSASDRSSESR